MFVKRLKKTKDYLLEFYTIIPHIYIMNIVFIETEEFIKKTIKIASGVEFFQLQVIMMFYEKKIVLELT